MNYSKESPSRSSTRGLLVYVPSLRWDPRDCQDLLERLRNDPHFADWQIETFDHMIKYLSQFDAKDVARKLAAQVRIWSGEISGGPVPKEIILVGHSLGGLLVREALLQDADESEQRLLAAGASPWPRRVSRVVLIASPNAGYELRHLNLGPRIAARALSIFGRFMFEQLEEGSEYITHLRLRWFQYMQGDKAPTQPSERPDVVQVFGTNDEIVPKENILDCRFIRQAVAVTVPGAGHADIVELESAEDPEGRFRILRHAICEDIPELGVSEEERQEPVVFILHGIRSSKTEDWIKTLEDLLTKPVVQPDTDADTASDLDWANAKVISPTYGHFGPGNFASPWIRRRNTRRLLLWYGNHFITHNPNNMFFVGHSNGTYMLGRSLLNVPSIRFRRIYLAASVLPRNFKWQLVLARRQIGHAIPKSGTWKVGSIHSDRGRRDVPVGWLCSMLNGLGNKDIGTGGFAGFDELDSNTMEHRYPGGHGHMLTPRATEETSQQAMTTRMQEVARFIHYGTNHNPPPTPEARVFSWVSRILGTATKLWALMIVGLVILAIASGVPWSFAFVGAAIWVVVVLINNF